MLLSQKLGDFTKGDADFLRKAMGKKDRETLDQLKPKFIEQAKAKGHSEQALEKIWKDWEAFAAYAFNKSHSVCYAFVAYQTAYLKAHYPAEFMAAVLTNNYSNAEKISFFLGECVKMGLTVLGPDINESHERFSVNDKGEIRFTLSAVKGLGESAGLAIIEERDLNGPYSDIYDFVQRVNLRAVNKRSMEALACSGAFDSLGNITRSQYVTETSDGTTFIDTLIRFGNKYKEQKESNAISLFGDALDDQVVLPEAPHVNEWDDMELLFREKEVIGIYFSGHPLDEFVYEQKYFCNAEIKDVQENIDTPLTFACLVVNVNKRISKSGNPFAILKIEDQHDDMEIPFFGEDYIKYAAFLEQNARLRISGMLRPRFRDSKDYTFKVSQIDYLNTVMDKEAQFLDIGINGRSVTAETIQSISELVKKHKGDKALRVTIDTDRKKVPISLKSNSIKVNINTELLTKIEELDVLSVSVRNGDGKFKKVKSRDRNEVESFELEEEN